MTQISQDKMGLHSPAKRLAPPPKRYRIGELARHTGLTRQTLHNYTRWGLIQEAEWTPGGHRLYDESVFTRLGKILRLRRGHTVGQIKAMLERDSEQAAIPAQNEGGREREEEAGGD